MPRHSFPKEKDFPPMLILAKKSKGLEDKTKKSTGYLFISVKSYAVSARFRRNDQLSEHSCFFHHARVDLPQ